MHLTCPHCRNPIEIVEPGEWEIQCPSCGSSFRIGERTTAREPEATQTIGRFHVLAMLGEGAFGTVYKAHDSQLDRTVAIKVPRVGNLGSKQDEERFIREARSAAQLRHPSIVPLHEVGEADGVPYLVSEFIDGITLADRLTAGRLSFTQSAELIATLADALHYAHTKGIVHRDVKPSNIMLQAGVRDRGSGIGEKADGVSSATPDLRSLTPCLMDFGLSKRDAGEITVTRDGQLLGTPAYMSPEQARGEAHKVDGRSDVCSLGVILYELLTGKPPFDGENVSEVLYRITTQPAESPSDVCPDVSPDFDPIIEKALSKDPAARFQTGQEMIAALRSVPVDGVNPAEQAAAAPGRESAAAAGPGAGAEGSAAGRAGAEAGALEEADAGSQAAAGAAGTGEVAARGDAVGAGGQEGPAAADAGDPGTGLPPRPAARPAGLSPWWSLDSQWRLGALMTLLLAILVGVNWGFLYLIRGPLGRAALAEEARGAGRGSVGSAAPLALAAPGARPAAAPGAVPAVRRPVPGAASGPFVCAMSYADPEQIARVLAARPAVLAAAARAADAPRPAHMRLELKHRLDRGRVIVLVDGRTVLSRPVEEGRGGRRSETHLLSIPAGKHAVEVRLVGEKGALEAKSKITGTMEHDRTAVLQADHRAARRKGEAPELTLAWSEAR
jgi:tRNA A-37 threonylcarbamoyl transferase component Bud32